MAVEDIQNSFLFYADEDRKLSADSMKDWFKEADIIGVETGITEGDVDAVFAKISKEENGLYFTELKECVSDLAKEKEVEPKELLKKLAKTGERFRKNSNGYPTVNKSDEVAKDEKEK